MRLSLVSLICLLEGNAHIIVIVPVIFSSVLCSARLSALTSLNPARKSYVR